MSELHFHIPKKRYGCDTTVISMRIPKDMLRDIDQVAKETGRTRNDVLALSLEFAIDHMEIDKQEKD